MDIRYKLYPYPMLAADMDDYIDSSFTFTVTTEKEIREIKFGFQLDLRNDGLFNMIQSGKAEYLIHIECPPHRMSADLLPLCYQDIRRWLYSPYPGTRSEWSGFYLCIYRCQTGSASLLQPCLQC